MRKMKRLKLEGKGSEKLHGMLRASSSPIEPFLKSSLASDAALNNPQKALDKECTSLHEILTPNAATGYHELSIIRCIDDEGISILFGYSTKTGQSHRKDHPP